MSKASKDNGFLPLANELAEQFARRAFKAQELAILFVVMRQTYGVKQRDSWPYTAQQVADATGIDVSDTRKHVKALLVAAVLREKDGGIGINPDLDQWAIAMRGEGKSPCQKRGNPPVEGGEIPPKKRGNSPEKEGNFPSGTTAKAANEASSAAPKDKKESIKETPSIPQGEGREGGEEAPKFYGLSAIAAEAEWGDGEQDRFFSLLGFSGDRLRQLRNLSMLQGKTAEQVKAYLAFSSEYRAKGWAYLEARMTSTEIPLPPKGRSLDTLVDYLQDPSKYPAMAPATVAAPVKVAQMRPADPLSVWRDYLINGMVCHSPKEEASCLYQKAKSLVAQGYALDPREVDRIFAAEGIEAAGRWLFATANTQARARKQAQREAQ